PSSPSANASRRASAARPRSSECSANFSDPEPAFIGGDAEQRRRELPQSCESVRKEIRAVKYSTLRPSDHEKPTGVSLGIGQAARDDGFPPVRVDRISARFGGPGCPLLPKRKTSRPARPSGIQDRESD